MAQPQVTKAIVGMGPAGLCTLLCSVFEALVERHFFNGSGKKAPLIRRKIVSFEIHPVEGAGGGSAYYKQDGALNSGFADLMALLDLDLLRSAVPAGAGDADYSEFLALVTSLRNIANVRFTGKLPELLEEYRHKNQFGGNLLAPAISGNTVDTSEACFLRCTVSDIFCYIYGKLVSFIHQRMPEFTFEPHFETRVTRVTLTPNDKFILHTEAVGSTGVTGMSQVDIALNMTGTRIVNLVTDEVAKYAFTGPANAEGVRANMEAHERLGDGGIKADTKIVIVGQALHGIDFEGVATTVIGANEWVENSDTPCVPRPEFAEKTGTSITMLARSGAGLPPPRLTYDFVWSGQPPMLETKHMRAFQLLREHDFYIYVEVRDAAMAHALGIHPDHLVKDATTDAQLERYLAEISSDNPANTQSGLHRQFAYAREFGYYPSANTAATDAAATAQFPTTTRTKEEWYNARHAFITSPGYVAAHPNADLIKDEQGEYIVFAAPPAKTIQAMGLHQESGLLKFVTGDAKQITPAEWAFKLGDNKYDIVLAPGIITPQPDDLIRSLLPYIKTANGAPVYGPGRQLLKPDGTPINFFDFGNNANGQRLPDGSTVGRNVRDTATLFANYTNKPTLCSQVAAIERFLVKGGTQAGQYVQDLLAATKPVRTYDGEAKKAVELGKEAFEVWAYLKAIRALPYDEWRAAYLAGFTGACRMAIVDGWTKGSDTEAAIASAFFNLFPENLDLKPKSLDEWSNQFVDLDPVAARTVLLATMEEFAE